MTKFFRLVRNEWRKLFSRAGTWIMVVLLCVVAIGATALTFLTENIFYNMSYGYTLADSCRADVEFYQSMIDDVKDQASSSELLEWQIELSAAQLVVDLGITDWTDWRYTSGAVYDAAVAKCNGEDAAYQKYTKILAANDPAAYFSLQKELFQTLYVGEQLEIYNESFDFCIEQGIIPSAEVDARYALVKCVVESKEILYRQKLLQESGGAWSEAAVEKAKNELAIAEYQLEHGMHLNPADSFADDWSDLYIEEDDIKQTSLFWNNMVSSVGLISLIALFCIIIAGNIVANEYAAGTVKFLLIAPIKRWKILFSKYATVLFTALLMLTLLMGLSLVSSLSLGANDLFLPAIYAEGGEVMLSSPLLMLLGQYALSFLEVTVMATLAFTISSMVKSSSVAVGISLFAYMMGTTVINFLAVLGFDGARYFIFANLDLAAIAAGTSVFPHQSLPIAILIIVLHMAVFLLTAYDAFVKREI